MKTIVELVELWYAEHRDDFAMNCDRLLIRSYESHDAGRGKVGISIETHRLLADITFWNRGQMAVLAVDKVLRPDHTLADRDLAPGEDVASLLSRYVRQIVEQGKGTSDET